MNDGQEEDDAEDKGERGGGEGDGQDSDSDEAKSVAREQRNKHKARTETITTPSNQTHRQADKFYSGMSGKVYGTRYKYVEIIHMAGSYSTCGKTVFFPFATVICWAPTSRANSKLFFFLGSSDFHCHCGLLLWTSCGQYKRHF